MHLLRWRQPFVQVVVQRRHERLEPANADLVLGLERVQSIFAERLNYIPDVDQMHCAGNGRGWKAEKKHIHIESAIRIVGCEQRALRTVGRFLYVAQLAGSAIGSEANRVKRLDLQVLQHRNAGFHRFHCLCALVGW